MEKLFQAESILGLKKMMERLHSVFAMPSSPLEARHKPSGLNEGFSGGPMGFTDYVARNRDMLRRVHIKLGTADLDKVVDGNSPFELKPPADAPAGEHKPYRRGVLLVHGLTGSPYSMRHLGDFFQANGFRVMAIMLPGHGTQPGDLLESTRHDWAKTVAYGAYKLAEEVDELYLAGYSVGGALSIQHSLRDNRVRGLFLFAPALEITPMAAFANLHKMYSWLLPKAKWVDIKPDTDTFKYESLCKNAAAQTHALTKEVRKQLRYSKLRGQGLEIPVFTAASADDVIVNISATLEFMNRASHPYSKLVLYTTDPENDPVGMPTGELELVNSVVPEHRILSSGHTAIVTPPDDAHYGEKGDYSNCIHYFPDDMESYEACVKHPEQHLQGEITQKNLKAGLLRRLMYNPNFEALKDSMRRFIERLE